MALTVVVIQISPGGQADRLGLRVGDVLVRYQGKPVQNSARFFHGRRAERPGGKPRSLEVVRQGKTLALAIAPGLLGVRLEDRAKER